jgi:hypothetical protein
MRMKILAKRLLGRALSVDFLEKLTEYSLDQRHTCVALDGAANLTPPGKGWDETVLRGREAVWKQTVSRLGVTDALLLEFGVFQGDSMRGFLDLLRSPASRFFGFDSFEGLPEAWRGNKAGHFSTGGSTPQIRDPRVRFVKGWFRDSLPPMLDELEALAQGRTVIVHFDADLYSSTLYLLFTLTQRFKTFIFFFDEFAGHEARALYNFMQASGAEARFHYRCDWEGFPMIVGGELKAQ